MVEHICTHGARKTIGKEDCLQCQKAEVRRLRLIVDKAIAWYQSYKHGRDMTGEGYSVADEEAVDALYDMVEAEIEYRANAAKKADIAEEKQKSIPKDEFDFGQKVIVSMPDGEEKEGRVFGKEPGECLRKPIEGTAYIIEFDKYPSLREWERFTSVGPEKLKAASASRG